MRRTRNTAGIPYSVGGRGAAFAVLVVAIAGLLLAAGYTAKSSKPAPVGVARLAARDTLLRSQAIPPSAARAAQAARTRAAIRQARLVARREVARQLAARRRAVRRQVTTVVVTERRAPAFSTAGANLCGSLGPRGGGKAQRRLRRSRALARKRTLSYLNLHC